MTKIQDLNHPLTNDEIEALFPGIKIIAYPSLINFNRIKDLTNNKYNACFILYINDKPEENLISGHWCLLYHKNNNVYLFDPYGKSTTKKQKGGYLDNNLIELGPERSEYKEDNAYLSQLLLNDDSIKEIYFNTYPYQQLKDNISTCGKHCSIRLCFYLMDCLKEKDYKKALDKLKKKLKINNYDNLINYLVKKNI